MLVGEIKKAKQGWEYHDIEIHIPLYAESFEEGMEKREKIETKKENKLSLAGNLGWELVSVVGYESGEPNTENHKRIEKFYFKRPLE